MKASYIFIFSIFFFNTSILGSQNLEINWWFDLNDSSYGQTAAGDIDGDGFLELTFGCYRNDSMVYALNANDGSLLWKYNTSQVNFEGCNDVATLIYDIDGDGAAEVVAPASCTPNTFCFNGNDGSLKWKAPTRGSDSPPSIADIDDDGEMEILHGEFLGYVICIDAKTGAIEWEIAVDTDSWIQTAPTIADLNGDGKLDFVVATWVADAEKQNRVYAYSGYNQQLLWSYDITSYVYHGSAVADIDEDGKPEVILGDYSGRLYAINGEDGTLKWDFAKPTNYVVYSPVSVADFDADGKCDLIFTTYNQVYVLNGKGEEIWHFDIPMFVGSFRGVSLTDINGDGTHDAVFGASNGVVYILNGRNGELINSIDLQNHYGKKFTIENAAVIADFDKNGTQDIFIIGGYTDYPNFSGNYGRAYCISIGQAGGGDWLMFQHNNNRNPNICRPPTSIECPDSELCTGTELILKCHSGNVRIEIPFKSFNTVQLFDVLGVELFSNDYSINNSYPNEIDLSNTTQISTGAYFVCVSSGDERAYFPIVIR